MNTYLNQNTDDLYQKTDVQQGTYVPDLRRKRKNRIKEGIVDRSIGVLSISLLFALVILIVVPLLSYFALAFSDPYFNDEITIFPTHFSFESFKYILAGDEAQTFWRSFLNSVIITVVVTIVSNLVEALAAYPLSKPDCPFRGGIMMYFIITMLFSAGIIPCYLLMSQMKLLNTIWSVILISISNVGNLLLFKTFFEGVSTEIQEAAKIDGASDLQMFFRIMIPMALPVFGSCCFFTIVGMWNSYGAAMLFISSSSKEAYPLAYYIYLLLSEADLNKDDSFVLMGIKNIQSAAMLLSIIPILCIYPFVIKYIKGGLQIGSVKG